MSAYLWMAAVGLFLVVLVVMSLWKKERVSGAIEDYFYIVFIVVGYASLVFIFDTCGGCPGGCSLEPKIREQQAERYWKAKDLEQKKHMRAMEVAHKVSLDQHKQALDRIHAEKKKWEAQFQEMMTPIIADYQKKAVNATLEQMKVVEKLRAELEQQEKKEKPQRLLVEEWELLARDVFNFLKVVAAGKIIDEKIPKFLKVYIKVVQPLRKNQKVKVQVEVPAGPLKKVDKATVEVKKVVSFESMRLEAKRQALSYLENLRLFLGVFSGSVAGGGEVGKALKIAYNGFLSRRDYLLCVEEKRGIIDEGMRIPLMACERLKKAVTDPMDKPPVSDLVEKKITVEVPKVKKEKPKTRKKK
jgi:hypothetical protein